MSELCLAEVDLANELVVRLETGKVWDIEKCVMVLCAYQEMQSDPTTQPILRHLRSNIIKSLLLMIDLYQEKSRTWN